MHGRGVLPSTHSIFHNTLALSHRLACSTALFESSHSTKTRSNPEPNLAQTELHPRLPAHVSFPCYLSSLSTAWPAAAGAKQSGPAASTNERQRPRLVVTPHPTSTVVGRSRCPAVAKWPEPTHWQRLEKDRAILGGG